MCPASSFCNFFSIVPLPFFSQPRSTSEYCVHIQLKRTLSGQCIYCLKGTIIIEHDPRKLAIPDLSTFRRSVGDTHGNAFQIHVHVHPLESWIYRTTHHFHAKCPHPVILPCRSCTCNLYYIIEETA